MTTASRAQAFLPLFHTYDVREGRMRVTDSVVQAGWSLAPDTEKTETRIGPQLASANPKANIG
jgi:hypothetical protein